MLCFMGGCFKVMTYSAMTIEPPDSFRHLHIFLQCREWYALLICLEYWVMLLKTKAMRIGRMAFVLYMNDFIFPEMEIKMASFA